jgi:hypothetical protein
MVNILTKMTAVGAPYAAEAALTEALEALPSARPTMSSCRAMATSGRPRPGGLPCES